MNKMSDKLNNKLFDVNCSLTSGYDIYQNFIQDTDGIIDRFLDTYEPWNSDNVDRIDGLIALLKKNADTVQIKLLDEILSTMKFKFLDKETIMYEYNKEISDEQETIEKLNDLISEINVIKYDLYDTMNEIILDLEVT